MNEEIRYGAFAWDALKEKANIHQHGLSFREATEAFADPQRIVTRDERHSKEEERLFCIGFVRDRVATVRFTYRGKIIRIIGAGFWRKGRKTYEKARS